MEGESPLINDTNTTTTDTAEERKVVRTEESELGESYLLLDQLDVVEAVAEFIGVYVAMVNNI